MRMSMSRSFLPWGLVRGLWRISRALFLWALSSPLLILTMPLALLVILVFLLFLFIVFVALSPALYFLLIRGPRRQEAQNKIIEAEYRIMDGED